MKNKIQSLILLFSLGCQSVSTKTPEKYLNHTKITISEYKTDSLIVQNKLFEMEKGGSQPFKNSRDSKENNILIDTLVYSPDKNKIGILVIYEYLGEKIIEGEATKHRYIDGYGFLAKKEFNNIKIKYIPIEIGNYENIKDCSKRLREMYFQELTSFDDMGFKYNFNDIRFWKEPIWNTF
jgi:hypothetical protein